MTFKNECTATILAWIKYTKCLNEVLRWASSPRDTISCMNTIQYKSRYTDTVHIRFVTLQKVLLFSGYLEVLVVDVSIHSEQPFQDGFGDCL